MQLPSLKKWKDNMFEQMNLDGIKCAYFIGIGGIGMSALARFFHARGVQVSGYDRTATPLTEALIEEGMFVHYDDEASRIPEAADLIVYTPAIPADNKIITTIRSAGKPLLKRSDVLGIISKDTYNICVAGTHGKTTTSSMVAHVLRDSGFGCNAFLGGITANYGTNFWSNPRPLAVIEADEYDRTFLKLHPDVISISSMDPDHLDIYGSASEMENAFIQFTGNLKPNGLLLVKKGIQRENELIAENRYTYHATDVTADVHAENISIQSGAYAFDAIGPEWKISGLRLNMGGLHNVENCLVAIAVAKQLKLEDNAIRDAVVGFKGVKRRFEYVFQTASHVFIDDYAHHPEELRALISGARQMFPERKCTVLFQPHLFSRTKDLADGFAESLDLADEVYLLPIYPARELPMPGVESGMIAGLMKKDVNMVDMGNAVATVMASKPELLLTAGAGNIDTLVSLFKAQMEMK